MRAVEALVCNCLPQMTGSSEKGYGRACGGSGSLPDSLSEVCAVVHEAAGGEPPDRERTRAELAEAELDACATGRARVSKRGPVDAVEVPCLLGAGSLWRFQSFVLVVAGGGICAASAPPELRGATGSRPPPSVPAAPGAAFSSS